MADLTCTTAGESHGPQLTAVVSGLPSGLSVQHDWINAQLARRQAGYGRSPRQRLERDAAEVSAGLRQGRTLGTPIVLTVANRDHASWSHAMAPWPTDGEQGNWRDRTITLPRPGHADLPGIARGGFDGLREVLERASARETAARVAGCALSQQLLAVLGVRVRAHVVRVGQAAWDRNAVDEDDARWALLDATDNRCLDAATDVAMRDQIDAAKAARDTVGGVVEIVVWGLPPGVGGYTTTAERLDGRLAGAVMSVQAMKAVEFGSGFDVSTRLGSASHDEIFALAADATAAVGALGGDQGMGVTRRTIHAGGIEGGMSNGGPLLLRVAMKPLPTLMQPLASVDLSTGDETPAHAERSDTCAIAAAAIVLESVVAHELARVIRESFGQQSLTDVTDAWRAYCQRTKYPLRPPVELPLLAQPDTQPRDTVQQ